MDSDFEAVSGDSIRAALLGQDWIDRKYAEWSWEHKYYTAVRILKDNHERAWLTYLQATGWSPGTPTTERMQTLKQRFRNILAEVGTLSVSMT
jgi:hypothetical protein